MALVVDEDDAAAAVHFDYNLCNNKCTNGPNTIDYLTDAFDAWYSYGAAPLAITVQELAPRP